MYTIWHQNTPCVQILVRVPCPCAIFCTGFDPNRVPTMQNLKRFKLMRCNVFAEKKAKERRGTKVYLSDAERRELLAISTNAYVYMDACYTKASLEAFTFSDHEMARVLGWSKRTVQRARLELTKAGWFTTRTLTHSTGHKHKLVYLGKKEVALIVAQDARAMAMTQEQIDKEIEQYEKHLANQIPDFEL